MQVNLYLLYGLYYDKYWQGSRDQFLCIGSNAILNTGP